MAGRSLVRAVLLLLLLALPFPALASPLEDPAAPVTSSAAPTVSTLREGLRGLIETERRSAALADALDLQQVAEYARRRLQRARLDLEDLEQGFRGPLAPVRAFWRSAYGGNENPPNSVDRAIDWLRRHQRADGAWEDESRTAGDDAVDGAVEATALALLPFLGFGETHRSADHGPVVRSAFGFLAEHQDAEGWFGRRGGATGAFRQAVATLVFCEGLRFSRSPVFLIPARRGLSRCLGLQSREGGWSRTGGEGATDPSSTAWMLLAFAAGRKAGLGTDPGVEDAALHALDRAEAAGGSPSPGPEPGIPGESPSSRMALLAMARLESGVPLGDPGIERVAGVLGTRSPVAHSADPALWFCGSAVLYRGMGERWKHWNGLLKTEVQKRQHLKRGEDAFGSWDPGEPGAEGRARATALNALAMEFFYRYTRTLGLGP